MDLRYLLLLAACLIGSIPTISQDLSDRPMRTLLGGDKKLHHGGWGAPEAVYSRVLDQDALLVGLRAGWLIDHRITIGIAGKGLVTRVENATYDQVLLDAGRELGRPSRFHMGYGGLLLEPVIAYRSPVHISLPVIIGAGGVGYESYHPLAQDTLVHPYRDDAQAFFVVEPGIDLEVNVIPLLRVGFGVSYRFTSDLDLPGTPKDALHGLNTGISLKVGRF